MKLVFRYRQNFMFFQSAIICCALVLCLAGCATTNGTSRGVAPRVIAPGETSIAAGTGIESQDLIQVTDQMARSILATPEISEAAEAPVVALYPVENNTRFRINSGIFTDRIKALLNSRCRGKIKFVSRNPAAAAGVAGAGNDELTRTIQREKQLKDEGLLSGGKARMLAGVDFFLTGKLSGLSVSSSRGVSDYIMYTFKLVDAETMIEVWEDFTEIKKEGMDDAIYR